MEITEEQYARIKDSLPVQRGDVSLSNLQFLNAVLYVAEHGCNWWELPKRFGNGHGVKSPGTFPHICATQMWGHAELRERIWSEGSKALDRTNL